ncbi:hypothetical protein CKJ80_02010 [Corynebacterium hadale]|uniref:Uncharacterized protein n=1 Tax=Corynebacterium hadale TaxID=2026255 RepID=A0AB36RP54_9CORY|nr:hypothetical protein CKJ80_02010 [Corynebacterium hadale]
MHRACTRASRRPHRQHRTTLVRRRAPEPRGAHRAQRQRGRRARQHPGPRRGGGPRPLLVRGLALHAAAQRPRWGGARALPRAYRRLPHPRRTHPLRPGVPGGRAQRRRRRPGGAVGR